MRLAILSDIHSNLAALEAVLDDVGEVDGFRVLGDIVGYGPEPDEVVARLRSVGATGVYGNHDLAALGGELIEWFNPDARAAIEWTMGRISGATRDWLTDLLGGSLGAGLYEALGRRWPSTVLHPLRPPRR